MITKSLRFVERNLAWLPILTIGLLILSDVLINQFIVENGAVYLFTRSDGIIRLLGGLLALILVGMQVSLCWQKKSRIKAVFALTVAILSAFVFFFFAEKLLPPLVRYTDFQTSIQELLARRSTNVSEVFCGVETHLNANSLGWIDDEPNYDLGKERIVFIGDSFLENRSSANVAERVENRLNKLKYPIEVINLAKANTDPQFDYRHKFYEFAFEYKPNHIFIFMYSGNDLSTHYRYAPFHHPQFKVSATAIDYLRRNKFSESVLQKLEGMKEEGLILRSKPDFLNLLQDVSLDLTQMNLLYLAGLGYSPRVSPSHTESLFPNAITRIKVARKEISNRIKAFKRSLTENETQCTGIINKDLREKYKSIYESPKDQRLSAIARFIANDYCGVEDYQGNLAVMEKLDPYFIDQVIHEPASIDSIPSLVVKAAAGNIKVKKEKPHQIEQASNEYVKLYKEFKKVATAHGAELTIVFIPVASHIDDDFIRSWKPLTGKGKNDGRGPPMIKAVRDKMEGDISFIDLTDYPDQFKGGYWIFDGHWNEKGNDIAAKIVTDYIVSNRYTPPRHTM